jgi:hypothetical protein
MKKLLFTFYFLLAVSANNFAQSDINISNLISFDGEPYIAINPTNSNNIIAGWMRLRLDGKIWIATSASFDGGQNWSAINFMPHDTTISNSADVNIAFHNSGTAYLSYIDWLQNDTTGAVYIAKSTDGGLTWSTPNKIIDWSEKVDRPFDRPWIAVDNSGGVNDGRIYFVCLSIYLYSGQHHTYLRSSDDGGITWNNIVQIDDTVFSPGIMTVSYPVISVGGDGKIYIAYFGYDPSVSPFVRLFSASSSDGGNTFQRNIVDNIFPAYQRLPSYTISANPVNNGHVIVSWCDTRYGDLDVLLSQSTDGGQTWSIPVRINDDMVNNGIEQDQVWSAYSATGKLALAWRDRRLNDTTSTSPFDIYAAVSLDGGNSFQPNFRMSSAASPYQYLSCCNAFIGLALTDSFVVSNWGDNRNADWEVYFNRTNITTTGIAGNETLNYLRIYPNPTSGEFIIEHASGNTDYCIMDATGKQIRQGILTGKRMILDLSKEASGIYFLKIGDRTVQLVRQ